MNKYEHVEPDYLIRIRRRQKGLDRSVPGRIHNKRIGEQFVRSLGISTPEVYKTFGDTSEINLDKAPDRVILKPTFLSSSNGVMALERKGDHWHDHLWKTDRTIDDIRSVQQALAERSDALDKRWVLEEKVEDDSSRFVPDDYKFYTFQGRIGLVHRVMRGTPRDFHAYYDGNFNPIPEEMPGYITVRPNIITRKTVPAPSSWQSLLRAAKRISVATPTAFVRIDMYNALRGPVFGEFTLVPGTFFYEDRESMGPLLSGVLGKMWEEAERDLSY